jgi:osmotically-inducible protein OsmY
MAKSDLQLKQDIEEELRWDPAVSAAQIGVTVDKGAVSLLGEVDSYAARWAAEDATRRVAGVRTVAQDLTVKLQGHHTHSDSEIAVAVETALKWNVLVPKTVTASVKHASITLEGHVSWNYQREAAERSLRYLSGVVALYNFITVKPQASAAQVKEKVEAALSRQAATDASSILVNTSGGTVTLTGHATSWQSIQDAANAAWAAPGVTEVVDQVKMEMTL